MRLEIDEQTAGVTMAAVALGWMLYNSDPATKELALWVGGAVLVVWLAVSFVSLTGMLTELMWWDYLWERTREKNGSNE